MKKKIFIALASVLLITSCGGRKASAPAVATDVDSVEVVADSVAVDSVTFAVDSVQVDSVVAE